MDPSQPTNEQSLPHKLAAILYADVEGYSRLTGQDEVGTHRALSAYLDFFTQTIKAHRGEVKHFAGDAVLADFTTVSDALNCAIAVQQAIKQKNQAVADDKRVQFRIGLNLGEVIVDRGEVYGNGVNVAARLETLAEPGGICISGSARDAIGNKLALDYQFLGEQQVKNIDTPVRAYRVGFDDYVAPLRVLAPQTQASKKWPAIVAAAVAVIALGAWFALSRQSKVAPSPSITAVPSATQPTQAKANRIAVLPFANLSADKENEYFSDGMTEEMISKLSRVPGLEVIARTSVITYKGSNKKISEIAKELNVGTVLEGSVRRTGDKLRITAQLINAQNETHLWSNDYDRELKDVFAVQSDVARRVAEALRVALNTASAQHIEKKGTENLQAYDLYLQGVYHLNTATPEGLQKARELFDRALELDPRFAPAHAQLALAYDYIGLYGLMPQKVAYVKQYEAAKRAIALDESTADAHLELGSAELYLNLNWAAAEKSFKRAFELNPNLANAYDTYSINLLCPLGRHEEAQQSAARSVALDPRSPVHQATLGWVYWCANRHERAIEEFGKALALEPNQSFTHWGIGLSYAALNRFDQAISSMQKNVELTDSGGDSLGGLGWAYAVAGRREDALATLEKLKAQDQKTGVEKMAYAHLYTGLGDRDAAFEWLEKIYDDGAYQRLLYVNSGNWFEPLRGDPRFDAFIKKLGLVK